MDFVSFWATAAKWAFWRTERTEGTLATLGWLVPAWSSLVASVGLAGSTQWWSYLPPAVLFVLLFMAAPYRVHKHYLDEERAETKRIGREKWEIQKALGAYEREVPQRVVDDLARLRSECVGFYAEKPSSDSELADLWSRHDEWHGRVRRFLEAHFSHATYDSFTNLGVIPGKSYDHAVNEPHRRLLASIDLRLVRLEAIIDRHNRDLIPPRSKP